MRDLLIACIIGGGSLMALRRPWIGVMLWTWVSLMNPHVYFGYASQDWPVAQVTALCTMVGLLLTRERQNPFLGPPVWALFAFALWITVTLPFSIYFDEAYPLWGRSMKIFLMMFVTLALVDTRAKFDVFVWVMVISIGYFAAKGGLFTLATGGNYRVWGPGGFIEGNNELALAVVMITPMIRYLQLQMRPGWGRRAMSVWMLLAAITALGSYSRGALLGVSAMAIFLWIKSDDKVRWGFLLLLVAVLILPVMPEQWWERMGTIETYDQDASSMGRINAWWMAFNLARDKIIFGGGMSVATAELFQRYAPNPNLFLAAHSIYFQILGEQGFLGLFLFLMIAVLTWLSANRLIAIGKRDPATRWAVDLGAMVQVSMVGYAVGGAFLSLAYFDLPYNMMLAVVLGRVLLQKQIGPARRQALTPAPTTAPVQGAALPPLKRIGPC